MNDRAVPTDPDDVRLDRWLAGQLENLTSVVSDAVDIEAGLRDACLDDRVQSLDSDVNAIIDIESGLRAVLPGAEPRPRMIPDERDATDFGSPLLDQLARRLERLPFRDRLRIRSQLPLTALRLVNKVALATMRCADPFIFSEVVRLMELLDKAITLATELARPRQEVLELARAVGENLPLARVLAEDLDRARSQVVRGVRTSRRKDRDARAIAEAIEEAHACASGIAWALEQTNSDKLPDTVDRVGDLDLDLVNALVFAFMDTRNRMPDVGAGRAPAFLYASDLATGTQKLEQTVTDFTQADLTDLDLVGVDLRGVWWSDLTTQWPPAWVRPIFDASVQLDPNGRADLYEVRDDPHIRHTVQ
jgi:hypothetical protein